MVAGAVVVAVVVGAAVLAAAHPALRFVDFVRFSERARSLWSGAHLTDRLYPVGYPALIAVLAPLCGSALVAGKVVSVASAAALAGVVARRLGAGAALWVLSSHAMLMCATTEGTDLPALALALAAVLSTGRPAVAGALLGGALLMRYTAVAAVPVVLAASPDRRRTLAALIVATSPHWAIALATGGPLLPDQRENLAIAAGSPVPLLSWDTARRWPGGFGRAITDGVGALPVAVATAGFVPALLRRDRRAAAVLAYGVLHAAALGLGFANARLALPVGACAALGAAWLLPPSALAAAAIAFGAWNLRIPADNDAEAARAGQVADLLRAHPELPGPVVATSPWFYRYDGVWIEGGIQLSGLGGGPRMSPAVLADRLRGAGAHVLALDTARTRRQAPGLDALLSNRAPEGWAALGSPRGWHVWRLDEAPPVTPP